LFVSPANKDVLEATDMLCKRYINSRYIPPADDWPPYHPQHYTPLTIIHHKSKRTESEVKAVAHTTVQRQYSEIDNHKTTKVLNDLFTSFQLDPYIILIEGSPGIGKTILSKEIALQWANNTILHSKKLVFLLFMRDLEVKSITNIQLLVKHFCQSNALTSKVVDWLIKTSGKYLTIILDGYDEVSEDNRNHFLSDGIIRRKLLPECGLVITSRPAASLGLHDIVNCRAEVLGFTEEDRQDFIQNALQGIDEKIEKLEAFLHMNPLLDTLCYVPLNMSILLSLIEDGIDTLPTTPTILYQKFVIATIVHFLKKNKDKVMSSVPTITSLNDLTQPYDQIIKELSQFAFLALQRDQLVFTLTEVKEICPGLTPANWYGLGLLKPSRYYKPQDVCEHESFHFLHFSIQEYMAAYHIASLPNYELRKLLQDTFWNVRYFNTWIMYVGITGGKNFEFKHFLSGNRLTLFTWLSKTPTLSNDILNSKIKCLHILHCLLEADEEMLSCVESMFQGNVIDLSNQTLSPNDVYTLAKMLSRLSNKCWEKINLSKCNIDDKCCDLLCELFHSKNIVVTFKTVDISYNNFHLKSLGKLCDVMKSWQVEELILSVNLLYELEIITPFNTFSKSLKVEIVTNQIFAPLQYMRRKCGRLLVTYMASQNTMILVYSEPEVIKYWQIFNCQLNNRNLYKLIQSTTQLLKKLNIIVNLDHTAFSYFIDNKTIPKLFDSFRTIKLSGFNMHSKGAYSLNIFTEIENHYTSSHEIVNDYLAAAVCINIQMNSSYIQTLPPNITDMVNINIKDVLKETLYFGGNGMAADDIAAVLSHNTKLQKLLLSRNNLQSRGAIEIAKALQNTKTLIVYDISNNQISDTAAEDIATVLPHNTGLQELYLNNNNLQAAGIIAIARGLLNISTLTVFNIANNKVSTEAVHEIASILSNNTKLQKIYLSGNALETEGAKEIASALQNTSTLTCLHIENANINVEAAGDIAAMLVHNTQLQELYLGGNNLQSVGAIEIAIALQKSSMLAILDMRNNNISDEAAGDITNILYHNVRLQKLYLHR